MVIPNNERLLHSFYNEPYDLAIRKIMTYDGLIVSWNLIDDLNKYTIEELNYFSFLPVEELRTDPNNYNFFAVADQYSFFVDNDDLFKQCRLNFQHSDSDLKVLIQRSDYDFLILFYFPNTNIQYSGPLDFAGITIYIFPKCIVDSCLKNSVGDTFNPVYIDNYQIYRNAFHLIAEKVPDSGLIGPDVSPGLDDPEPPIKDMISKAWERSSLLLLWRRCFAYLKRLYHMLFQY